MTPDRLGDAPPQTDEKLRDVYPAVVIDETQPLHGHVSHMTPPEQDFAWKGRKGDKK